MMPGVPWARLAAGAATLALVFALGWVVRGWRAEAELAGVKHAHATQLEAIAKASARAAGEALAQQQHLAQANARIDALQGDLSREQTDNERLRAAVADGSRRVYVRAACPAGGTGVPQTAAGASVDADTEVELAASAGLNVLAVRAGILEDQAKLDALQRYAVDVCQGGATLQAPP
jgi:prophage endopeptidase